jgi:UDP-GlcNAc:undecaprenyl-phosphate GlcNAc-1-phosphate transferase
MLQNTIILPVLSLIISIIFIPFIIKFSRKYGIFDKICERKIHNGNISRLGGVAVFAAFFPVAVYYMINNGSQANYALIAAMAVAFLSGFIDDLVSLRARYKLIIQITAASLAAYSGLLITGISIFSFYRIEFGILSYFITVFWIIVFMNAVNLIDGMDGLSTGTVLVANFFVIIIAAMTGNYMVLTLALILECSILGFYIFNFPPAKIFLGDGGAYFIGFVYAVLPLMGIKKSAALTVFLIPLVLMLIPLTDILSVMYKRYKTGHKIFNPDNNHLHYRLMNLGFATKGILAIVYSFTAILGCFAILLVAGRPELTLFMLGFALSFVGLLFFTLDRAEKRIEGLEEIKGEAESLLSMRKRKAVLSILRDRKIS